MIIAATAQYALGMEQNVHSMYFQSSGPLLMNMYDQYVRALERVGAILIDARCELEEIEIQTPEMNELHGEITRAYALCWQIMNENKEKGEGTVVYSASA